MTVKTNIGNVGILVLLRDREKLHVDFNRTIPRILQQQQSYTSHPQNLETFNLLFICEIKKPSPSPQIHGMKWINSISFSLGVKRNSRNSVVNNLTKNTKRNEKENKNY